MDQVSTQNKKALSTTEPAKIKRIIEQLYLNFPCSIIDRSGAECPARLVHYNEPHLRVSHTLQISGTVLLIATYNGHSFIMECEPLDHTEQISILNPRRIIIRPTKRKEHRFVIPTETQAQAGVSNIMLRDDFLKFFATLNEERDRMIKISQAALFEILPENVSIEFYLRRSDHIPVRLRQLARFNRAIFAPSVKETGRWYTGDEFSFLPIPEYEKIQRSENLARSFSSEICEPLVYKEAMTYGYIQVRSNTELNLGHYKVVAHIARQFEKDIEQNKSLPINRGQSELMDISQHGIGFLHPPNKEIFRQYQNGETLIFDVNVPQKLNCTLIGRIKSSANLETNLRFGLELGEQYPEQQSNLNAYIYELGMQTQG